MPQLESATTIAREGGDHPTTVFLSVHRGASSFIAGAFAREAERCFPGLRTIRFGELRERRGSVEDITLPPNGVLATRVYPGFIDRLREAPVPSGGRFVDKKLIVMRRDPRDAAVSWYYSTAFSHPAPPNGAESFMQRRAQLREMGVVEGIRRLIAEDAIFEFRAVSRFLQEYPDACEASYELLVTDCRAWTEKVAAHLRWPGRIVEELLAVFEQEVSPPGRERPGAHRRRITPGNWRIVFDEELCKLFERGLGDDLIRAGYVWDGFRAPLHHKTE